MARQFTDSGDEGSEWSEGHMALGFRVCTYNHEHKSAPVHVHDRYNIVVGGLPPMRKQDARKLVRIYVDRHDWFDMELLQALAQEMHDADTD